MVSSSTRVQNNNNNTARQRVSTALVLCDIFVSMLLVGATRVDHATGAARRRKERRLRACLMYARMSVAMALAEANHHSAPRRQKTATAEATYDALRSQTTSVAGDTGFFSLYEEELGGTRLFEVRPQERNQRHTVVQTVDSPQVVPSLDVPVPQRENQLVEACRHLDLPIPESAIKVPKISSSSRPGRRRVRFAQQMSEQLVEVLTVVSYSSLHGLAEQNVYIPVPHGRGGRVGEVFKVCALERIQQRYAAPAPVTEAQHMTL